MTSENRSNHRCIKLLAGLKYVTATTAYIIRKRVLGHIYTAIPVEGPKLGIMLVSSLASSSGLKSMPTNLGIRRGRKEEM